MPPHETPFQENIQKEKQLRINQLWNYFGFPEENVWNHENTKLLREKRIKEYFAKEWIDFEKVKKYLIREWVDKNSISRKISLLNFDKWKNILVDEILNWENLKSPIDLAQRIADYIKKNIDYDYMSALSQLRPLIRPIKDFKIQNNSEKLWKFLNSLKEIKAINWDLESKLLDPQLDEKNVPKTVIENFLNENDGFDISNHEIDLRINGYDEVLKLSNNKMVEKERENIIEFRQQLILWKTDKLWLKKYISENYDKISSIVGSEIERYYVKLYSTETEIYDMIKDYRIWVCRDFSMIAKELYQECYNKIRVTNPEFPESEMIFVWNKNHAYNRILREDKSWNIQWRYLDLTEYITQRDWNLFNDKDPNLANWELRVANERENKYSNIA